MMRVIFSRYAQLELEDAAHFYERHRNGLGESFRWQVKEASVRIATHPEAWSVERGEIRKCLLHQFPYKILYSIEHDHIFIIAIAHRRREPDYWISR